MGRRQRLALLGTLLAGFALRVQQLTRQDIWWDEARNIDVALRPFLDIPMAFELDIHPLLYFWVLHLWSGAFDLIQAGDPQQIAFVTRYLSVAAGVAGVVLVYQLARRLAGHQAGLYGSMVAGLSPFWLAESQESRMYTLGFALLAAAAVWLLKGIGESGRGGGQQEDPASIARPALAAFVVLCALALLTHYNAVFILAAWYGWWGVWALWRPPRRRRLGTVVWAGLAMAALVLPATPIALRQIPGYANPNLTVPDLASYLGQNWQSFVGGYAFESSLPGGNGDWWLWGVLGIGLAGLLLVALPSIPGREHRAVGAGAARPVQPAGFAFLAAWLVGGLALYYLAVLDRGAFHPRYSSFVTPALYALLGVAVHGLGRRSNWLAAGALALVMGGMLPASYADLTDPRFFREDTSGLAAWLRAEAGPGDVVFVDQKYPFGFYYRRYSLDPEHVPVPDGPEAAPARYLFVDINTVDGRLTEWGGEARRVFWVQWYESDTDPRGAVTFLLDKYGRSAGEQRFQGYLVRWWDLEPPTIFALAGLFTSGALTFPAVQAVAWALPPGPLAAGQPLPVVIRWQPGPGTVARPLKARIALYSPEGARLAQDDRRILNDRHLAPSEWWPEDRPLNVYMVWPPADLAPGRYELRLLVYDAESLDPLGMVDEAGNPAELEPVLGTVTVEGR